MLHTDSTRIYALGDIHGCIDMLEARLAEIRADLAARPHGQAEIVFLGDYTDRGPDSRAVLERLIAVRGEPQWKATFLRGNHDHLFLRYLEDADHRDIPKYHWLHRPMGGDTTLASYGVAGADGDAPQASQAAFRAAVPASHIAFLQATTLTRRIGSYLFVHAGIRPGIALEDQAEEDLIWIRDPFLTSQHDPGFITVHGHTPVDFVEHHGVRIAIDTGAVFGRTLSCLVLEGGSQALLQGAALTPI